MGFGTKLIEISWRSISASAQWTIYMEWLCCFAEHMWHFIPLHFKKQSYALSTIVIIIFTQGNWVWGRLSSIPIRWASWILVALIKFCLLLSFSQSCLFHSSVKRAFYGVLTCVLQSEYKWVHFIVYKESKRKV